MITVIILVFVAILTVFLIAIAWGANARKRASQAGVTNSATPDLPKVGRSPGPN